MGGKPGVLQCWNTRLMASECLREGDDFEPDSVRISEYELVSPIVRESVLVPGDAIEAPGA